MEEIFNKSVSFLGLGYIGLPTAALVASKGIKVNGVDIKKEYVESINGKKFKSKETGLEDLVQRVIEDKSFLASSEVGPSDVFVIAVPTPFKKNSFKPDISFINRSAEMIAPHLKKDDLIILESTSPIGTTSNLSKFLSKMRPDLVFPTDPQELSDISIAYCPERVIPGKILKELVSNDRVIGGITRRCAKKAEAFYKIFVSGDCFLTDSKTAEMVKLTENSSRDVQIAFANELSMICDKHDIDVFNLISLANKHPRVDILNPGPGVGGHCIAVDPWFLVHTNKDESLLIQEARKVNLEKTEWIIKKINIKKEELLTENDAESNHKISITFFGLTYKNDVDDIRESPSLEIAKRFSSRDDVKAFGVDPNIHSLPKDCAGLELVEIEKGIQSDMLVLLVNHKEFAVLDKETFHNKILIDAIGFF
tara:strand:+ start:78 stop:1346 length:1269 start_codon:yes stop_codon:yes gene_type:complete